MNAMGWPSSTIDVRAIKADRCYESESWKNK